MYCRLFIDPPASGAWNMAVDETLLESAATDGGISLRFYRWEVPTLSLGFFQQYEDRLKHSASLKCPVVRRATGGGAILHDREITYSIAIPPGHRLAVKHLTLYETIHSVLINVLADYGIQATLCKIEGRERDCDQPFLCFQRRSPGDVLLLDTKIAGSAQRRYRGAVLQHGSVLLSQSPTAPELLGIAEVAAVNCLYDEFVQSWTSKLAETITIPYQPGTLTDSEQRRIAELFEKKYYSCIWTVHRGRCIHI
jgi:lipoate-protein ligase A